MPEYTVLAVLAVLATIALERWSRTRVFARAQFWCAMAIVFAFQVLVDGWLTKLSAPIVIYSPEQHLGIRWPWDVPIEDYLFGFAMVAGTIILWERAKQRRAQRRHDEHPTTTRTPVQTRQPSGSTGEEDAWQPEN
jgi:lycopene cyclase domain-containing protein